MYISKVFSPCKVISALQGKSQKTSLEGFSGVALCKGGGITFYLGVFGVSLYGGIAQDWITNREIVGH